MRFTKTSSILMALVLVLAGCESLQFSMMKDDELIAGGVKSWNTGNVQAARSYWSNIKDPAVKDQWLGRIDQWDAVEKAFEDAQALAPTATTEAPLVAAWDAAAKALGDWPTSELNLPSDQRPQLVPVAKAIVRLRINAGQSTAAKEFIKTATAYLGDVSPDFSAELKEMDALVALRALEKSTDAVLTQARGVEAFDDQVAAYETAIATYAKAEASTGQQAKAVDYPASSPLAQAPEKFRRKKADARVELDRKLRDRAYSFKERIGGIFARSPETDQPGSMGPQDILTFYQGVQADIEATQKELVDFAVKYPKVIDRDMLRDVETQKQDLQAKIVQATAELKKALADAKVAAEIASRGKVVFPLLIGLFNPQPGTKGTDAKSRPGKFKGTQTGDTDYWWGMTSIAPGNLNDLVITVSDSRPVRVFADNTKSGTQIDAKKLKDLVNRQYKVGNAWPVINAGAQLVNGGFYYFELGKPKEPKYSGDVVVYSSFIVRQR